MKLRMTLSTLCCGAALLLAVDAQAGARIVQQKLLERKAEARRTFAPESAPESAPLATTRADSDLASMSDPLSDADLAVLGGAVTGISLRTQVGLVRRSLDFSQDVYDRLRKLQTNLYVYRLDAAVYPSSFRLASLGGRVGLIAGYEGAFSGSVRDADFGADFTASHSELFGGLRARHVLRGHVMGFDLTLGRLQSGLDDLNSAAGTPDVSYGEVRSALDFTLNLGRVRATAAAGFRVPLGYGEISQREWFPRVGGYGIDASLGAGYLVSHGVSVDVAASLRRFVLEMNSQPEDGGEGIAEVAGGAVDSYLGAYVGMSFAL